MIRRSFLSFQSRKYILLPSGPSPLDVQGSYLVSITSGRAVISASGVFFHCSDQPVLHSGGGCHQNCPQAGLLLGYTAVHGRLLHYWPVQYTLQLLHDGLLCPVNMSGKQDVAYLPVSLHDGRLQHHPKAQVGAKFICEKTTAKN